jgi:histidine triad (HIT) family protein
VVPKEHVENIHEGSGMDYMWDSLVKVSNAVKEAFDAEGINIAQNNGEKTGQEVFHLHFHVTPVYDGDELEIKYNRSELTNGENISEQIGEQID